MVKVHFADDGYTVFSTLNSNECKYFMFNKHDLMYALKFIGECKTYEELHDVIKKEYPFVFAKSKSVIEAVSLILQTAHQILCKKYYNIQTISYEKFALTILKFKLIFALDDLFFNLRVDFKYVTTEYTKLWLTNNEQ